MTIIWVLFLRAHPLQWYETRQACADAIPHYAAAKHTPPIALTCKPYTRRED